MPDLSRPGKTSEPLLNWHELADMKADLDACDEGWRRVEGEKVVEGGNDVQHASRRVRGRSLVQVETEDWAFVCKWRLKRYADAKSPQ